MNVSFSISKVIKGSHKKEELKLKRRDNNECILKYLYNATGFTYSECWGASVPKITLLRFSAQNVNRKENTRTIIPETQQI